MQRIAAFAVALIGLAPPMAAEANDWSREQVYPTLVASFEAACVRGDLTVSAREAAIAAEGWQPGPAGTVDVDAFNKTAAIEVNFDFRKPDGASVWTKTIDGKAATLVLATYPEKRRYQTLCAIAVSQAGGALAYDDALDDLFKARGIRGKSTDLPHYFEWASKLGADNNPVRAEILSRSQVLRGTHDLHLYIAF